MQEFGDRGREQRSVILWGAFGTGKSTLAVCGLRAWIEAGGSGLFATVPELLDSLRPGHGRQGGGLIRLPTSIVERISEVPLLVLDDIGAERTTGWAREQLFRLVNHRYNHCLPTIFTSNYTPDEIKERLAGEDGPREGERVVWRLVDDCDVIELRGRNLRELRD